MFAKLPETGSNLSIQDLGAQACIHGAIYKHHLPYIFCTHVFSQNGLQLASWSHCGSPGQVYTKHAGPHLTLPQAQRKKQSVKDYAANIYQASQRKLVVL